MFSYILLFNEANSIFLTVKFGCFLIYKMIMILKKPFQLTNLPLKFKIIDSPV